MVCASSSSELEGEIVVSGDVIPPCPRKRIEEEFSFFATASPLRIHFEGAASRILFCLKDLL